MSGRLSSVLLCLVVVTLGGCAKQPPAIAPAPVANQAAKPAAAVGTEPTAPMDVPVAATSPADDTEKKADPIVTNEKADKPSIPEEAAAKAPAASPKEMLKLSGTGVVLVSVYDALGEKAGFGSGCIIDKGLILTNYHVVATAVTAKVQPRGTGDDLLGTAVDVIGYRVLDEKNDLAVLAVAGLPENLHIFKLAAPTQIEQYDRVFAIGHPDGLKFSTSPGFVNSLMKTSDLPEQLQGMLKNPETEWIQTDAVIAGGSSGGPLLNEAGEIVGINTLRVGTRAGLAVKVGHVSELVANLSESNSPLPVPDANVLVTKEIAEIKRGFDLEYRQFIMDMQGARVTADPVKMQELMRKNNPAPDCVHRCLEIARKHPGELEAEDAIKLCAMIMLTGGGARMNFGREYLDELFEEASRNAKLIPPSLKVIGSLNGMAYSAELEHYLRSVMASDAGNVVRAAAGVVLLSAMSASETSGLEAEMIELAKSVRDQFGDERFHGKSVTDFTDSLTEGRDFEVGNMAAEIEGKDAEGKEFLLSDYRGKVVVLDFWADWCPHCRNMYPHERELVERLKDQPFALLGVNGDEPARAKRAIAAGNVTWRSWLDGPAGPIAGKYKIEGWPTVYVLDKEGRIRFKGLRGEELEAAVDSLLNDIKFLSAQDIIDPKAEWKFRAVKGTDELSNWQQAEFDDSAWTTGAGAFGYGQEPTKLEQLEPGQRPLTTLFRRTFDLPAGDATAVMLLKMRYRDGLALSLNGKEIYRDHLKADASFDTPATSRASDQDAIGVSISIDASLLKPKDNCLTAELHQFSSYSAEPFFELTLGSMPDLAALMATATASQQSEIVRLLHQVAGLPGAAEILEKLQAHEAPDLQLHAAIAAAMNELPVSLKKVSDPDAQRTLAQEIVSLNQQAWTIVSRDDFTSSQYAEGLRKARAAHALLPLVHAQFKQWLNIVINTYGVALYRNEQYDKAQEILKESLAAQGDNPVDTAYLSLTLKRLGKADEALEQRQHFTKLLGGDIWKHESGAHQAKKELDRQFAN